MSPATRKLAGFRCRPSVASWGAGGPIGVAPSASYVGYLHCSPVPEGAQDHCLATVRRRQQRQRSDPWPTTNLDHNDHAGIGVQLVGLQTSRSRPPEPRGRRRRTLRSCRPFGPARPAPSNLQVPHRSACIAQRSPTFLELNTGRIGPTAPPSWVRCHCALAP